MEGAAINTSFCSYVSDLYIDVDMGHVVITILLSFERSSQIINWFVAVALNHVVSLITFRRFQCHPEWKQTKQAFCIRCRQGLLNTQHSTREIEMEMRNRAIWKEIKKGETERKKESNKTTDGEREEERDTEIRKYRDWGVIQSKSLI